MAVKKGKDLKIIFMGTPEFALPVLEALADKYTVCCVVTRPDTPKGRGHKMAPPPAKELAERLGIPVMQPVKVKTDDFPEALAEYNADLFVTCAYGRILTEKVLALPPMGIINVHASLLPKYRGAAPLWWQVVDGEKEVGVTTMQTDAGMDTGDILLKKNVPLGPDETMGQVHDKLSAMGAELIIETIEGVLAGSILPQKQQDSLATYAPMVSKEDGKIDWRLPPEKIHNLVRGMNPFPSAWTQMGEEVIKIHATALCADRTDRLPGTVLDTGGGIRVATGEGGVIIIKELQAPGSKKMDWKAYLNGHQIPEGTVLG